MSAHALWTDTGHCGAVAVDARRYAVGLEWGARSLAVEAARALLAEPSRDGSPELLALHPVASSLQPAAGRPRRGHRASDPSLGSLLALGLPADGVHVLVCELDDSTLYWLAVDAGAVVPGTDRVLADRAGALAHVRAFSESSSVDVWHADPSLAQWLGLSVEPGEHRSLAERVGASASLGYARLVRRASAHRTLRALGFAGALVAVIGLAATVAFTFSGRPDLAALVTAALVDGEVSQPEPSPPALAPVVRPTNRVAPSAALRAARARALGVPSASVDDATGVVWVVERMVLSSGDLSLHERTIDGARTRDRLVVPASAVSPPSQTIPLAAPAIPPSAAADPRAFFARLVMPLRLSATGVEVTLAPRLVADAGAGFVVRRVSLLVREPFPALLPALLDTVPGLVLDSVSLAVAGPWTVDGALHALPLDFSPPS